MRYFVDVARCGSFTAVAKAKGVEPSSVSRAVASLEAHLGARLLQRTTRSVVLTEIGSVYLSRVDALIDDLDHARDEVRAASVAPTGTLRMTSSFAFGQHRLAPLLPAFRELYPAVKVELVLNNRNLNLISDRLDLAVRMRQPTAGDMMSVKLLSTRYHVVASPDWVKRNMPMVVPADLQRVECLLLALPEIRSHWQFLDADGDVTEITVRGGLVISDPLSLQTCVLDGGGPALLIDVFINDDIAAGRLVDLFPNYRVTATEFETGAWLLYPSRAYLPMKTRVMIDFLRSQFGGSSALPSGD